MTGKGGALYYGDYLHLEKLLSCQELESEKQGVRAHDEMLFIIVHQAYELWFKQILWELDAVLDLLGGAVVDEENVGRAVSHLGRVAEIQRVLLQHIDILETMTPLDFLDFRDYLIPASGFQSVQFRLIENKLGMRPEDRARYSSAPYTSRLHPQDRTRIEAAEQDPSLFLVVDRWLARTPFLHFGAFDFWTAYRRAVDDMLGAEAGYIDQNPNLTAEEKDKQLRGLEATRASFEALFDADRHEALVAEGHRRMSHQALQAALLIHLYRDKPILHLPFRLLSLLVDVDENFTTWRYRHALMVLRMIGTKIGTGGSSGHEYLRQAAERNKVFTDLINLSTFLIPRSALPKLPPDVDRTLGFQFTGAGG